jgi:hypothetical protein
MAHLVLQTPERTYPEYQGTLTTAVSTHKWQLDTLDQISGPRFLIPKFRPNIRPSAWSWQAMICRVGEIRHSLGARPWPLRTIGYPLEWRTRADDHMELLVYGFSPLSVEFIGPCESASAGMLPACHAHLYIWPWASSSRVSSLSTLLSPLGENEPFLLLSC